MKTTVFAAILGVAAFALPLGAETIGAEESYDLLFRNGTLDAVDRDDALGYRREVTNELVPDAETRDTGEIRLAFLETEPVAVELTLHQDGKWRGLGSFPASVGNPIIMYFYETTVRDMAEAAGGSPFYIRNRVKDALTRPAEIETGRETLDGREIETTRITLRPFENDPNRDQMQGFGDLTLSVTMSDEVPGWYLGLEATVPGADQPIYHSTLTFDGTAE